MDEPYPAHVGIILDGNRRWAKEHNLPKLMGHKKGFDRINKLVPYIIDRGVKILSIYCFSTENFKRDADEVSYLMDIFVNWFHKECKKINEENIKIVFSGRLYMLREDVQAAIKEISKLTKNNTKGILNVCIAYGGRQEIVDAAKNIAKKVQSGELKIDDIDETVVNQNIYQDLPPIDLLIRTSGEQRISNFMLWNMSYAEMYFPEVKFPDFDENEFEKAIAVYRSRDRRMGGNSKR